MPEPNPCFTIDRLDTSRESNTTLKRDLRRCNRHLKILPPAYLCGSDGLAAESTTLSRAQVGVLAGNDGLGLLDNLLTLGKDELDVARVRHVGVDLNVGSVNFFSSPAAELEFSTYTTVGTVSTSALLGGLVDLDVLDDKVGGVETLGVSVGLGVLQETEQELGRLDGPAGAGDTELLACVGDTR